MKFFSARLLLASLLLLPSTAALAALELSTEAFRDVEVVRKDGKKEVKRESVKKVVPGQEVIYVITYRNTGKEPAAGVVINNPVPAEMAYQSGSAQGLGSRVDVSVDGGKTFGALEALKVTGKDGKPRAAEAADVTGLRWTLLAPVKASAGGLVTYRARLR